MPAGISPAGLRLCERAPFSTWAATAQEFHRRHDAQARCGRCKGRPRPASRKESSRSVVETPPMPPVCETTRYPSRRLSTAQPCRSRCPFDGHGRLVHGVDRGIGENRFLIGEMRLEMEEAKARTRSWALSRWPRRDGRNHRTGLAGRPDRSAPPGSDRVRDRVRLTYGSIQASRRLLRA